MTFGLISSLPIRVFQDADEAAAYGFNYNTNPEWVGIKPLNITQVVVVQHGMQSGAASVDFILEDEEGQKFFFMIPANLLKSIPT